MAFNGNFMCTSFKKELLYGVHDFDNSSGDTFKIALYTNSAYVYCGYYRVHYFKRSKWYELCCGRWCFN